MGYVSHRISESRLLDCVYDPNFILADTRDVLRANSYAMSQSTPIQILSKYDLIFSSIPRVSRQIYLQESNNLSNMRLTAGEDAAAVEKKHTIDVCGKDRSNFFYHPQNMPNVINLQLDFQQYEEEEAPKIQNFNRTIGCQTKYRESSAQTNPYQPDAVLCDSTLEDSDIIAAARLITGFDQPGDFEAQVIERSQKRRKWEKMVKDTGNFEKYKPIIEAFEWEEWLAREKEIEDYQNMRMDIVMHMIEKRERNLKNTSVQKIENTTRRIEERRRRELEKLETEYKRKLRKLERKHKNICDKYVKENVTKAHADPSSDLYGPQMRFGENPNRRHYKGPKNKFESRLINLDKIINETKVLECPFAKLNSLAAPKKPSKEYTQGFCKDKHLKQLYESLKYLRSQAASFKAAPRCYVQRISEVDDDRDTETIIAVEADAYAESEYQSSVYLQKIMKGRAIQNILYTGKKELKGLIDEIRNTFTLDAVKEMHPADVKKRNKERYIALSRQKRIEKVFKNEKDIENILKDFEGSTVGWLLEFFEKELDRLYEQKQLHAICLLAEEERQKREEIEIGKRHQEEAVRQEYEEIYGHMSKCTRDTITMYLEDVIMGESDVKAAKDARKTIQEIARKLDKAAEQAGKVQRMLPPKFEVQKDERLIADLVENFLFPEVQKKISRRNMELSRRLHLIAAHEALYSNLDSTFVEGTKQSSTEVVKDVINDLLQVAVTQKYPLRKIIEHPAEFETLRIIGNVLQLIFPETTFESADYLDQMLQEIPASIDLRNKFCDADYDCGCDNNEVDDTESIELTQSIF